MRPLPCLLGPLPRAAFCLCLAAGLPRAQSLPVLKTTLPASWDESWFGSPVVFDLDGDGSREIIAARHSVLYVWGADGGILWRAAAGSPGDTAEVHGTARQYAGPVVGDLDGDGKGEIAVAYSNRVAVYAADGSLLPGWPKTLPGPAAEVRSLAAADLDGDGKPEILAVKSAAGASAMAFTLAGAAVPGWPQAADCEACNDFGGFNQNLGAADLDGDGKPEVVVPYDGAFLGVFHPDGKPVAADTAFAGPWASSVPMFHDLSLARQGHGDDGADRDEFTQSAPVFADLDGDGRPEILLYSNREKAGDTASHGNCLWALRADMTRAEGFETPLCSDAPIFTGSYNNLVETAPIPALGNLTGDPRPEIVVPSSDGKVRAYSPEGEELWKYTYDVAGEPWIMASEAAIGDLNKDGKPEIVFTTYSVDHFVSHLTILDAAGRMQRKVTLDKRGAMGAPTLADADGDGRLDIVLSLKDVVGGGRGGVQIWTVESAGDARPDWPTGRGSYLRTGRWGDASEPTRILKRPARRDAAAAGRAGVGYQGRLYDALGIRIRAEAAEVPRLRFSAGAGPRPKE